MASYITSNKKGSKAAVLFDSDATVTVASLAVDGTETVTEAKITGVYWSAPAGSTITVVRNGITVLSLNGSGAWPLYQNNISLNVHPTSNVVATVPTGSTLVLELRKTSDFVSQYYGR